MFVVFSINICNFIKTKAMFFEHFPFFIQGMLQMFFLFVALFLWYIPNKTRTQRILMIAVFYWTFIELKEILFYDRENVFVEERIFIDLLGIPFAVFYAIEVLFPRKVTIKYMLSSLAPFLLISLIYWNYKIFNASPNYTTFSDLYKGDFSVILFLIILYCIYTLGYIVYQFVFIFRKSNIFSWDLGGIQLQQDAQYQKWVGSVIYLFLIWIFLYFFLFVFGFEFYYGKMIFVVASLTLQVYAMVKVFRHESRHIIENLWLKIENIEENIENNQKDLRLEMHENKVYSTIAIRLEKAFNEKKMYLNPKLTIVDLANECQTNRTYLSEFFNSELNCTFNDYVNKARIERVSHKMLLDQENNFSIEEIAMESGFNSLSTFRRAFEKFSGDTPLNFKNKKVI